MGKSNKTKKKTRKKLNKKYCTKTTKRSKSLAHYAMKQMLFRISPAADIFKCMSVCVCVCLGVCAFDKSVAVVLRCIVVVVVVVFQVK